MPLGRLPALLVLLFAAGGCAAPVGDFGRPRPPLFGGPLLSAPGEVSEAPLTDQERELRDLAYAIVMPAGDRQMFNRTLLDLVHTHLLPADHDPSGYSDMLLSTPYRSSTARYARLIDDIRADSARAGPFFAAAARVAEMDAVREKALAHLFHLSSADRDAAIARMHENRALVAWVQRRFGERRDGYRLALERLVAATPAPAAVEAERTLHVLEARLAEVPPLVQVAWAPPPPAGTAVVSK